MHIDPGGGHNIATTEDVIVTTTKAAVAYRERVMAALPAGSIGIKSVPLTLSKPRASQGWPLWKRR